MRQSSVYEFCLCIALACQRVLFVYIPEHGNFLDRVISVFVSCSKHMVSAGEKGQSLP